MYVYGLCYVSVCEEYQQESKDQLIHYVTILRCAYEVTG